MFCPDLGHPVLGLVELSRPFYRNVPGLTQQAQSFLQIPVYAQYLGSLRNQSVNFFEQGFLPLLPQPAQNCLFAYLSRDLWGHLLGALGLSSLLARDDPCRQTSLLAYRNRMLQKIPSWLDLRGRPVIGADERPPWRSSGSSLG
jgi:hypothetical protein